MKFVVDESAGQAVVEELCRLGHDVISIHEQAPSTDDADILNIAVTGGCHKLCGFLQSRIVLPKERGND